MPRANRYFLPGHVWHITHRCHQKEFLLKFAKDRNRWLFWLFEAKKRYGLCILNYVVTSNHIHLLVKDSGNNAIVRSMQLVEGRVAQEYNQRKKRKGAFWEDRYHATVIAADEHLSRCLTYIDLNMVRAGVVEHPMDWDASGYAELFSSRQRYNLIDRKSLQKTLGIDNLEQLRAERLLWVEDALRTSSMNRDSRWSEGVAVGRESFVKKVKADLEVGPHGPKVRCCDGDFILKEEGASYNP